MTFTRTKSGLANYKYFFDAEIVFYIEGRCEINAPIEDHSRPDTKFYASIAKEFIGHNKIKIKLVGNRKSALDYLDLIVKEKTPSSYVFIDKDYQGLVFSPYPKSSEKLMTTHGYSWENDLWTSSICMDVLSNITGANKATIAIVEKKLKITIRRLAILSSLNAAAHTDGKTIFPRKGHSKGLNLSMTAFAPLTKTEFSRVKKNFPKDSACHVMKETFLAARKCAASNVIQGHLLEHICLLIITHHFKEATGTQLKNNEILKNLALSKLSESPRKYLTAETYQHYSSEFSKIA